jgi:serine/threonine protein kinase
MTQVEDRLLADELADEFEVIRRLGEGSVARVFLARDLPLQRLVAIKVLRSALARDDVLRQRFVREARSAGRITSRNVVAVHRVGTLSDGRPYTVMEYVQGRDLESRLAAEGVTSVREGRLLLAQIARGLEAAHRHGIVHRDVRPANVLRADEDGRAVLTDFGIAAVLESHAETVARLTLDGQRIGDIRYSSPEQIRGERVTAAADVYSLAIIAYELLAARGPFEDAGHAQAVADRLDAEPVPLNRLREDADPILTEVLLRCLAREPTRRPSAGRLAAVLEADPDDAVASRLALVGQRDASALRTFHSELKRRRVYTVGGAYIAGAVVAVESAAAILGVVAAPAWVQPAIVVAAFASLPVVLALAWTYDITAGGIRRTRDRSDVDRRRQRLLQLGGIALSLVAAALIAWWLLSR